MTNGEKIQTILDVDRDCTEVHGDNGTMTFTVTSDFWNAEYKEPNKSEIPTGSATKNDLGVDCISRADVLKLMQDNWHTHNGDWAMQESMDDIRALQAVTPIRPKGHWREVDTNMYACSECSHVLAIDTLVNSILEINTCPFCSVKMKGVIENERKID